MLIAAAALQHCVKIYILLYGVFWIGVHTLPEVYVSQSKHSPEIGNTESCPGTELTRTGLSNYR